MNDPLAHVAGRGAWPERTMIALTPTTQTSAWRNVAVSRAAGPLCAIWTISATRNPTIPT